MIRATVESEMFGLARHLVRK